MKRILTSFAFVAASLAFAQVSIASSEVEPEATLDIRAIDDGSTPDGILIPRVTKAKAESMPTPEKSTLVYINEQDVTTTIPGATKTTDVDAEGFYYFKDGKWVKLGGSSSTSTNLGHVTGNIQPIPVPVAKEAIADNTFTIIATAGTLRTVELPNPSGNNDGRILSVNNQSGNAITFSGNWQPVGMTKLAGGAGHVLISDGSNWYVIGGIY